MLLAGAVLIGAALIALALLGGPVARAAAACAAGGATWGMMNGGMRHLARWLVAASALFVIALAGPAGAAALAAQSGLPSWLSLGIVAIGIWVVMAVASRVILNAVRRGWVRGRPVRSAIDRVIGTAVGATEGLLIVALFFWTLQVFDAPLRTLRAQAPPGSPPALSWALDRIDACRRAAESDAVAQPLLQTNPLKHLSWVQQTHLIAAALASPESLQRLIDDPRVRDLVQEPLVRERLKIFTEEGPLNSALKQRNIAAVLGDARVRALLADEELIQMLHQHLPDLLAAVADAGGRDGHPGMDGFDWSGALSADDATPIEDVRLSQEQVRSAERALFGDLPGQ